MDECQSLQSIFKDSYTDEYFKRQDNIKAKYSKNKKTDSLLTALEAKEKMICSKMISQIQDRKKFSRRSLFNAFIRENSIEQLRQRIKKRIAKIKYLWRGTEASIQTPFIKIISEKPLKYFPCDSDTKYRFVEDFSLKETNAYN